MKQTKNKHCQLGHQKGLYNRLLAANNVILWEHWQSRP